MKQIEIDKIFKEKILERENSSSVYKQDYWNKFEKQLDKTLPVAKKSNYLFSLNNILIVLSVLTCVILIPLFFLPSGESNKSAIQPQRLSLADRNVKPNINHATIAIDKNSVKQNSLIPNYISINNTNYIEQNVIPKNESFNKGETSNNEQKTSDDKIAVVTIENVTVPETKISIKNIEQIKNEIIVEKDTINNKKNNLDKVTGNKTSSGENGKHGKKKRKNILVPTLNYNGF